MLDGRHTGTGGGNHVTIGGATPADSPVLRRPDLLRSLVTYWQHHPSLSYLFSGLFVGPTSQAPRVDEARDDSLYELEIAFQQVPSRRRRVPVAGRPPVPQSARRRHRQHPPRRVLHRQALLARRPGRPPRPGRDPRLRDAAARAHEPGADAPAARAGRALLDASRTAARWCAGTRRCTIASCCRTSSGRTCARCSAICSATATPSRSTGSRRSSSSAFPRYGTVRVGRHRSSSCAWRSSRGTCSARRSASQGTARYVDSSVERLQVKATGLTEGRHVVTCNGRRVPLRSTGRRAECVAGVRYRAWQPPSALHPTIGVARAAGLRRRRHLDRPLARRLHLSRRPSGRAQLRDLPGQRQRGRGAPRRPLLAVRPHARADAGAARGAQPGVPLHARSAADGCVLTDLVTPAPCRRPRTQRERGITRRAPRRGSSTGRRLAMTATP